MNARLPTTPETIFQSWQQILEAAGRSGLIDFEGKIQWVLTGEAGGSWLMCGGSAPTIEARHATADCTLTLSVKDFVEIACGELNPQVAYLNGQITFQGDLSTVLQLSAVLELLIAQSQLSLDH